MRIPRIYTPQSLVENSIIELSESTAHYIANVLRMKAGRELVLFNGQGGEYQAVLKTVSKKKVSVEVKVFHDINSESPLKIELGVGVIKSDRMDWLIQKATELGVSTITPLISVFTDVKLPVDRYPKKVKHWQQVAENAAQQSGRTVLPEVHSPQPLTEWIVGVEAGIKLVLHPYDSKRLDSFSAENSIAFLVGPEGGLSDTEVELARMHDFSSITLGPRILRSETAPLAAIALLQHQFGDL